MERVHVEYDNMIVLKVSKAELQMLWCIVKVGGTLCLSTFLLNASSTGYVC